MVSVSSCPANAVKIDNVLSCLVSPVRQINDICLVLSCLLVSLADGFKIDDVLSGLLLPMGSKSMSRPMFRPFFSLAVASN